MIYRISEVLETLLQQGASTDALFVEAPELFDFVAEEDEK